MTGTAVAAAIALVIGPVISPLRWLSELTPDEVPVGERLRFVCTMSPLFKSFGGGDSTGGADFTPMSGEWPNSVTCGPGEVESANG